MDPTIVVVARGEDMQAAIARAVEAGGGQVIAVSSLGQMADILCEVPISGILMDLVTTAKAPAEEKRQTNDLIQLYPHTKFRVLGDQLNILGKDMTLDHFLGHCRSFQPRIIRSSRRSESYEGVFISASTSFEQYEKTITLNVSKGGCFIFSPHSWKIGEKIWLCFKGARHVMTGTICWWQPWGNKRNIPGIGIRLDGDAPKIPVPASLLAAERTSE